MKTEHDKGAKGNYEVSDLGDRVTRERNVNQTNEEKEKDLSSYMVN